MNEEPAQHTNNSPPLSTSESYVEVDGKRRAVKPGSVIVCGACSLAVPDYRWGEHRESCWNMAHQFALLEELAADVELIERAEDLAKRLGLPADVPLVPCPTCGAQAGELCVNAAARAMRVGHQKRRELIRETEARLNAD